MSGWELGKVGEGDVSALKTNVNKNKIIQINTIIQIKLFMKYFVIAVCP